MADKDSGPSKLWTVAPAILSAATALIVGIMSFQVNKLAGELNTLKADREFHLKIHKMMTDSLTAGDDQLQLVSVAFIKEIKKEDLRESLLRVLVDVGGAEAGNAARAALAALGGSTEPDAGSGGTPFTQTAPPASPTLTQSNPGQGPPSRTRDWEEWDIDVFYCEDEANGVQWQDVANKIVTKLQDEGARGRLRVRVLSKESNERAGYRIHGRQVRHQKEEQTAAENLLALTNEVSSGFTLYRSVSKTPWYLSVFVCSNDPAS